MRHATGRRTGRPIVYAVTIPNNAPHPGEAARFVDYMVGRFAEGREDWPESHTP
jgi:molybdate/tungstate transport system substrate-binding protein